MSEEQSPALSAQQGIQAANEASLKVSDPVVAAMDQPMKMEGAAKELAASLDTTAPPKGSDAPDNAQGSPQSSDVVPTPSASDAASTTEESTIEEEVTEEEPDDSEVPTGLGEPVWNQQHEEDGGDPFKRGSDFARGIPGRMRLY